MTGWNVYAQDPHYTQASRIPSWYNPAAAGHGVEHIRLTMLYRNQWSSVMSPFKTQGLFFDKQVGKVGFGGNLVNNSAGDVGFRQLFINGQLSYRFAFGKNIIATGFQVGMIQKSFDPSKMTFDDQYTPDQGASPTTPTTETFSYTKITRPDLGAGLLWTYGQPGQEKFYPYVGLSMQHINQPKESFIVENNFIPRKITANGGVGIVLSEALTITPMITFSQQQFAQELLGGVIVKMPLEERNNIEGGLLFRNKDAAALYAGYQWNNFMFGMSYDVNISGLTGGPGAFELTLTYIPKAKEKKDPTKKEKDKKLVEQPKTETAVKNSNVPSSAAKPPVPVVTPTPKATEKSVPAAPAAPVNTVPSATSNNTTKPTQTTTIVSKPSTPTSTPKSATSTPSTRTSTSAIKPPAPTSSPAAAKSKTSTTTPAPKTATATPKTTPTTATTPAVKAVQPAEKVEMKTVAMKKSKGIPVVKMVLDPKKSTKQPMLVNSLPLEGHDHANLETIKMRGLPAKVQIKLPKLQPLTDSVKSHNTIPLESQEIDSINPIAAKPANVLPVVAPALPDVKKTDAPASLGIPTNVDEVPSSMSLMTPKNSVVQRVNVKAPELKKATVKKSSGLPIEKDDEVVSKLPTLIPAPVATSVVTDSDQDGVSDNVDPCPYIKGSAATGGCPDTDGDGVIDMNDQCPMEAGDATLNGCPAKKELSDLGSTIVYHFGNIEFEPLSAKVHGIYKLDVIEPALDTVSLHDDLFIVISGHCYREGDAPANMELSQARADAVRAIFLKKGMPEEKIQTVAYGETVPLKNDLTEEGKQQNRRVEVHVIRKKNP